MEAAPNGLAPPKVDDEAARRAKRAHLKELNTKHAGSGMSAITSYQCDVLDMHIFHQKCPKHWTRRSSGTPPS